MIPDGVVEWLCLRAFVSAAKLADGDTAHRRGSAGLNMRHSQSKKVTCFLEMRAYRTILLEDSVPLIFSCFPKNLLTLKSIFGYFRIWRVCVWHPCPKKNSPHGLNLSSAASCWMLHGGVETVEVSRSSHCWCTFSSLPCIPNRGTGSRRKGQGLQRGW